MGRIKKAAGPKHEATISPALSEFVTTATNLSLAKLSPHLRSFPTHWPFPRGDLYHWIAVLDRFDGILESFIHVYGLKDGPQTRKFDNHILIGRYTSSGAPLERDETSLEELQELGYSVEGDRELVETILGFSRLLLENCGNRSLYNSSERLGELFNTTSLSLLSTTLRLTARLAIRYHNSRQRGATAGQHFNNALLASHYNINLDRVQKLAEPFVKANIPQANGTALTSLSMLSAKTKGGSSTEPKRQRKGTDKSSDNDLLAIATGGGEVSAGNKASSASETPSQDFEEWGDVSYTYYQMQGIAATESTAANNNQAAEPSPVSPSTPTPTRRTSALSRPSRLSTFEDVTESHEVNNTPKREALTFSGRCTVNIARGEITASPIEEILTRHLPNMPKDVHYEFLSRVRAARALSGSLKTRRELLAIRILAVTNLAYVYPEPIFQQKILQQDSDEPRRLQLAYQLAELVQISERGESGVPLPLKTIALGALEALARHKNRTSDVCSALSINVSHGVLLFIVRKSFGELVDENEGPSETEEWREALFSLLETLPQINARHADLLIASGLYEILIEILTLRTDRAQRVQHKAITFMNATIHTARDAFQTFAQCKGMDIISELVSWEVSSSLELTQAGKGLADNFKTKVMDYQMPFFKQQTLRSLLKFVNHMMQHGNANTDRLLRNLIDTPTLLDGLRQILANGKIFGSNIWCNAVTILSSFIHNEPTSYAVIAEAGLSKSLLESISSQPMDATAPSDSIPEGHVSRTILKAATDDVVLVTRSDSEAVGTVQISRPKGRPLAGGIIAATDVFMSLPQAFGAICLNTAGLQMFLRSGALESFFECFESPDHVKTMAAEIDLPRVVGSAFDELVRHHPGLRSAVMYNVVLMLARVGYRCRSRAWERGCGAKLWTAREDGCLQVSGGLQALAGNSGSRSTASLLQGTVSSDEDVTMDENNPSVGDADQTLAQEAVPSGQASPSVSTYIGVAAKFLAGFFENQALCSSFIQAGGLNFFLDLATLPSLPYDFNNDSNNNHDSYEFTRAFHMLVEAKPHLVLPLLVQRTAQVLDKLEPLTAHQSEATFFSEFTHEPQPKGPLPSYEPSNGTAVIKALVHAHTLCSILSETFSQPLYSSRSSHSLFSQVNLSDQYIPLVKRLGRLQRACIWEEVVLQSSISDAMREDTRFKGYGLGSDEADEVFGIISNTPNHGRSSQLPARHVSSPSESSQAQAGSGNVLQTENGAGPLGYNTAQFKNVQIIRYLLSQIPVAITPFFQGLGRSLVPRRRMEHHLRQNAFMVAEALAEVAVDQLQYEMPKSTSSSKDRYAYWIVVLTSLSNVFIEGPLEKPHAQCLTLILQAFRNQGGLDIINDILHTFYDEVQSITRGEDSNGIEPNSAGLLSCALGGIKLILVFFTQITSAKFIAESLQSQGMAQSDRDREHPQYFSPGQFLVELRVSVLSAVQTIWGSDHIEESSSSILKCLIDILKAVLEGDHEQGAFKKSDKLPVRGKVQPKPYHISAEKETGLQARGYQSELIREALFRCTNNLSSAEEYCEAHSKMLGLGLPRVPIPANEAEKERQVPVPVPQRSDSETTIPNAEGEGIPQLEPFSLPSIISAVGQQIAAEAGLVRNRPQGASPEGESSTLEADADGRMAMSIDNLLNLTETDSTVNTSLNGVPAPDSGTVSAVKSSEVKTATIEDLDEARSIIRKDLIDRVLDILSIHDDITFDLSDLIITAAAKAPDAATVRKEIGDTLVQSLISFQMQDDFRPAGKKIASYANLLAIVIQEKDFYDATLDELSANFGQLLSFVKIFPDSPPAEPSPWIGQTLVIAERLLAEEAQPQQIRWTPPSTDLHENEEPIASFGGIVIPSEEKAQLFEALMDVMPHVGKDQSLALSVVRILVILTRNRETANKLADKRNLQRLFVMVKQLGGISDEKFQSAFMLVLRHIVEDDETLRKIMRAEITACFDGKAHRPIDTTTYARNMYALVLRAPETFLEVTNEKLKLQKFDPSARPQMLELKESPEKPLPANALATDAAKDVGEANDGGDVQNIRPTTEVEMHGVSAEEKVKAQDIKAPVVEHPDGVVHYLLSQLLSYKDVEDREANTMSKRRDSSQLDETSASIDAEMAMDEVPTPTPAVILTTPSDGDKKPEKPDFKAEEHPIYLYRCFLLQCLTELLMSYTRAKIEFINYSRKADPKAMTPSKPRSGVLNYLLNALIPVSSLEKDTSIASTKRNGTSTWAMSVVVALCLQTTETYTSKRSAPAAEPVDSDLVFVRKFVLEHALKAYKDVQASTEALEPKYAKLLSMADLFIRILIGRVIPTSNSTVQQPNETGTPSQTEVAKIMFEKNFISTLTASIADIDLNFPNSKRAIKYILRPLKILTQTAIYLSENSDISTTLGHTDDDEISTASSVSDLDDEREETPDLFRHSTLGMLEPGRGEASSSESSDEDEEMYDDEYDDGMEYEDEIEHDDDEVVSDEDEDIDGVGPMEGLPGDVGMDVEVVIDDEDDEASEDGDDDSAGSDEMDEDEEVEVIEELDGDDGGSMHESNEDEWQDEDEVYDFPDDGDVDSSEAPENMVERRAPTVQDLVTDLQNAGATPPVGSFADLNEDIESGRYMAGMELIRAEEDADDDDDEEDEEDDGGDDGIVYEPDYEDEDDVEEERPFGWDDAVLEPPIPMPRGHHHHNHIRRIGSPWTMFTPGTERGMIVPTYRSHRNGGGPRGIDDGVNPLLQRTGNEGTSHASRRDSPFAQDGSSSLTDWVHMMNNRDQPEGAVSFIHGMMNAVGANLPRGILGGPSGALHLHIDASDGSLLPLPQELRMLIGGRHRIPEITRAPRDDPSQPPPFHPTQSHVRWQEEARLLFGTSYVEKTQQVVNSLLKLLVPPALEAERLRKQKLAEEAEAQRKKREEEAKAEEERLSKEKVEKEAQEKQVQEERDHAARLAAEQRDTTGTLSPDDGETTSGDAMEGVEAIGEQAEASVNAQSHENQTGPSSEMSRVRATFRGREVDITGLGIDLDYLDALPEEFREEVLMQALEAQRSQAGAAGEAPAEIDREFLDALPEDLREEILQQEAQDRRRREREEQRRRNAAESNVPAARAEEMDPASFLASLDPGLRNAVLLEQDDDVLNQLPAAIAAEARALGSANRILHRWGDPRRQGQQRSPRGSRTDQTMKKPARRQIVQMLDKAGVATILRLLFIAQQGSSRDSLYQILQNVAQNRQNRAEVISLLLSILQDGSADMNAIERSFMQLSMRARQMSLQKTPQSLKRTPNGLTTAPISAELTPLMVIQQCLSALVHLTELNPHVPSFFLTEHDASSPGIKNKSNKKGKGKDTRASKFALNSLLTLLDRRMIMDSAGCMEQLSSLLQSVTHPLTILLRKEKDSEPEPESGESEERPLGGPLTSHTIEEENAASALENIESTEAQRDTVAQVDSAEPSAPAAETLAEDVTQKIEENPPKKQRSLTPPVVPEHNLRLVVNIITARECNGKTFRDTLSTINNLSAIPGAKEVFGKELVSQAQDLGKSILGDLDELAQQIRDVGTSTDLQGMALSKFSPSSSDQTKLLRVLTALDYLFDPKRNGGKTKPSGEVEASTQESKEDLLLTLYENSTFSLLWVRLGDCLRAIRQRDNMMNVATILLPLVESLMVVCKNTTLKDTTLKISKEFTIQSPPPETLMENLFFRFTEDHRKILNDLVRQNPRLMSGTFSLLVKNPKVLEFDNKRNYFTRRLHSRSAEQRHPQPPLQLSIRRDQVFMDSYRSLYFKSPEELKFGKLSIRFHGEEGVDAGGVTREWFQAMSRQMFNADYALFIPVASDRTTFHPNKLSHINPEHLMYFKFIGRIIGKALYEGRPLDCHFSRAVYKRILGKSVSIKDMETLDLDYYKSLLWMLENDISDIITETFSIETEDFGVIQIVDLVENGRHISVTEENKQEYVQLVIEHRLTGSVKEQLEEFLKGFHDIVPAELISIFNEQELELLISGLPDIDVDDWKNNTEYHNYSVSSAQIQWFWRAVRSFDKEERAKLLQFVTGTSKVPLNGFKELEGMNGFSRFNIHRDYGNKDRLPSSHTCFNQLDLPEYEDYETLRKQLYTAMTAGSEYFGFA